VDPVLLKVGDPQAPNGRSATQVAVGYLRRSTDRQEQSLGEVLERYGVANLWAATGWFLERTREVFHVPDAVLERHAHGVPRSAQYLDRGRRGGTLHRRWNLIVPADLERLGGPDER
jgi:hypothetical protein